MEQQMPESTSTREILQQIIDENPGIRYREILRMTGLANGVLSYHLGALEKSDQVRASRESRMTRYYPPRVSDKESEVLKYVRHEPIKDILLFIFENEHCTFDEIVEHACRAPSTISSHLKRLKEDGIISIRYGEYHLYRVTDKELVADVLSKYRPSYADRIVDSFAETMEEL
ncbi:MAG TPA: winged helix-turn-helix transcriptional regulator [Nitrososphaera sp.]|nr:winged helix-turn-helix transcriptional regulator [Nitrososphaera sp.]